MRIFKTKAFYQWSKDENLADSDLKNAIKEIEQGLYDANLGGNIYKKRIAIRGRGKSGGLRNIIAFKIKSKAFFMYGFAKNKRANISNKEEKALKLLADIYLNYSEEQINKAIKAGELIEVLL